MSYFEIIILIFRQPQSKELTEKERKLVEKITKKEIEWREAYKKELIEKGKLTPEQASNWVIGEQEEQQNVA